MNEDDSSFRADVFEGDVIRFVVNIKGFRKINKGIINNFFTKFAKPVAFKILFKEFIRSMDEFD